MIRVPTLVFKWIVGNVKQTSLVKAEQHLTLISSCVRSFLRDASGTTEKDVCMVVQPLSMPILDLTIDAKHGKVQTKFQTVSGEDVIPPMLFDPETSLKKDILEN